MNKYDLEQGLSQSISGSIQKYKQIEILKQQQLAKNHLQSLIKQFGKLDCYKCNKEYDKIYISGMYRTKHRFLDNDCCGFKCGCGAEIAFRKAGILFKKWKVCDKIFYDPKERFRMTRSRMFGFRGCLVDDLKYEFAIKEMVKDSMLKNVVRNDKQ
jgi:hypothetical protein